VTGVLVAIVALVGVGVVFHLWPAPAQTRAERNAEEYTRGEQAARAVLEEMPRCR
jgi:hypothetical protein